MVFSGIPFLYYFLPLTLLLYFAAPRKLKNAVLLIMSLVFYGWGEPKYLIFMVLSILQGYIFGLLIEKHQNTGRSRLYLTASVMLSLGMLCYCKYADFFIANFNAVTGLSLPLLKIALPIGISFYTFQILSYAVDVYRGSAKAQRSFVNLAAYIAMFPQLIAGPIVRYTDIADSLDHREHTAAGCAYGVRRFVLGLGKKVLIANTLGELCSIFRAAEEKSVLFFWLYAVAYTLHVYFDFSGYSDMAIGLGRIFGFRFMENFNYPYISGSITEFWRRWHISLGSWFRDYLYIPLGGNRVPKWRWYLNIFIVWMSTGLWHGAAWNFAIWGLMFAVLLVMEKQWLLKPLERAGFVKHIYVMLIVILSFVVFDAANIADGLHSIAAMFGGGGYPLVSAEALYYLRSYGLVMIIGVIGSTPIMAKTAKAVSEHSTGGRIMSLLEPVFLALMLIVCTAYLVDGSFNPFLYFRF
ncbi:MAG: MBOAT family protein [Clostridia bacterium]|nr:MBOAT family protein [Clostridia bacterium]